MKKKAKVVAVIRFVGTLIAVWKLYELVYRENPHTDDNKTCYSDNVEEKEEKLKS